ncbi:MAG: hypothetical protein CMH28_10560 [Micavibrio sp.]|nr:hypothetical protein [Micavibrio sp.]
MLMIAQILSWVINILIFVIIIEVVLSWLIVFEVINVRNPQAQNLIKLIKRITDPIMQPVRKIIPPIGGIDITPIIVILGLSLLDGFIMQLAYSSAVGY